MQWPETVLAALAVHGEGAATNSQPSAGLKADTFATGAQSTGPREDAGISVEQRDGLRPRTKHGKSHPPAITAINDHRIRPRHGDDHLLATSYRSDVFVDGNVPQLIRTRQEQHQSFIAQSELRPGEAVSRGSSSLRHGCSHGLTEARNKGVLASQAVGSEACIYLRIIVTPLST